MTSRLLLFLAFGFSAQAFATAAPCEISEDTVLTHDWIFHCEGDVVIKEGVTIITHEFQFSPRTSGTIVFGSVAKPAQVRCLGVEDNYDMTGKDCGRYYAVAGMLDGGQRQDCSAPGTASCAAVVVTSHISPTYHQTMKSGDSGSTKFILGNVQENANVRWLN